MKLLLRNNLTLKQKNLLRLTTVVGCFAIIAGLTVFLTGNLGMNTKSVAAPGKTGAKSITSGTKILNEYTTLTSNANATTTSINVSSSSLNANSRFSGNLTAGELIMIIQMQGASTSTTNNATYGTVSAYNNCGNYEFAEVSSIPSGSKINLTTGLKNSYTSAGKVQVIRVPRYTTLSLSSGATITCDAWDGTKGGIVALEMSSTSTINGNIDVSGLGFRGGVVEQNTTTGVTGYRSSSSSDGADKGESIAGYQSDYANGQYGRGAPANGGGGGNAHNGGGGGGANGGSTSGWNGYGIPDNSYTNWTTAWNIESANFASNTSTGGGRGGYGWSNNNLNPLVIQPGVSTWNGDYRPNVGGMGGRPVDYNSGKIFMGGGGGAGDSNNNNGTSGGDGGGMIFLLGGGNISGTGILKANGADVPATGTSGNGDGCGGGGAGGTVIVYLKSATLSNLSIQAKGGLGGNHDIASVNLPETEGPGGGGGGGYVALTNSTAVSINVSGAKNGTTNSGTFSTFLPNGATSGAAGTSNGTAPLNPYSGTSTLPVDLISFSAKAVDKQVLLSWATASEKSNDYFSIERSKDAVHYEFLGKTRGNGNSTTRNEYGMVDSKPNNGTSYYRLSQTDFNGKTETFPAVPVSFNNKRESFTIENIYPNPFTDQFSVALNNESAGTVKVKVTSLNGQLISKDEISGVSGNYVYQFTCPPSMIPGVYMISFTTDNECPVMMEIVKK